MAIKPPRIPLLPLSDASSLLREHNVTAQVALLGVRAYYKNTMGVPKRNDRGIYDDAIFVVSPTAFLACNANVDPGYYAKHIASLQTGKWLYKVGTHGLSKPASQRYTALVQAGEVVVDRDQEKSERGFFGINIHKGGYTKVSSEGCQTIHPDQWKSFIDLVQAQLKLYKQKTVPYLLIDNDGTI